ncbi:DUF2878 domain-containing protein [Bacterioplanes sanyensis]|uniref:DUF2878 domain-containing protein n=1 Tax=Bacterioplanes sanyensis TaxID=1249553 RepID=UPI00167A3B4D|nr:DUF2878 domain-containing protein [Bacterioplanes sanyensis]
MVIPPRLQFFGNLVIFQLCWLACVVGGNLWAFAALPVLILWHRWLLKPGELMLLAGVTLLGVAVDSVFQAVGWLQFPEHYSWLIPPWLMILWLAFATTLRHSLEWLMRHPGWAALLGLAGAPWSYFAGAQLGAVDIQLTGYIAIAVFWALLLGLLSWQEKQKCVA